MVTFGGFVGTSPMLGVGRDDGGSLDSVVALPTLLGRGVLTGVAAGENDDVEGCIEKSFDGASEGWSEDSTGTTVGEGEAVVAAGRSVGDIVGAGGFVLTPLLFERFDLGPLLGAWL